MSARKWDVSQVARYLGVSMNWVYRRLRNPESDLPYHRIGKLYRFDKEAIDGWLKHQR